jgi:APA family basic amino acid/polyamine antiporter
MLQTSTMQYVDGALEVTPSINLVGAIGILAVTALLVIGVHESAQVNNAIVVIKVSVLLAFIIVGVAYMNPDNWVPFVPPHEGGDKYGIPGIIRAASLVFFAYVGFEAVSTAAGEARNPQKDIPVGILGALFVCTLLYVATTLVLTGVVPFRELGVPEPIALAVDRMDPAWARVPWPFANMDSINIFSLLIKIGAFTGLSSVMLVLCYAQTRIFYQMAKDGLMLKAFARINPTFRTPAAGTVVLGIVIAIAASSLPLGVLGDLVSLGTAMAFAIVCVSVMYLRKAHPDLARPFKVPFYPLTPILGIFFCVVLMMGPIVLDIVGKGIGVDLIGSLFGAPAADFKQDPVSLYILGGYIIIGVLIYAFYGYKNSKIAHPVPGAQE